MQSQMTCIYGLALLSWAINLSVPQFPHESNGTINNSFPCLSQGFWEDQRGQWMWTLSVNPRMLYKYQALICVDSNALSHSPSALQNHGSSKNQSPGIRTGIS